MIEFKEAVRENIKGLVMLAGGTGSGKTYSALLLARGLVGPEGRIAGVDTEAGRMKFYANLTPFDHADMAPPFAPTRFIEVIDQAEAAGYDALIIDSFTHVWSGEGGVTDMAEQSELKTGRAGLHNWAKPKGQHKKLVNRILRSRMHIIFCCRAHEKVEQVKRGNKTEIVSKGWQPICERDFPYEMTLSAVLDQDTKEPSWRKLPDELVPCFAGGKITLADGQRLGAALATGVARDHDLEALKEAAREAARQGKAALQAWWSGNKDARVKDFVFSECASIASAADAQADYLKEQHIVGEGQDAGDQADGDFLGSDVSPSAEPTPPPEYAAESGGSERADMRENVKPGPAISGEVQPPAMSDTSAPTPDAELEDAMGRFRRDILNAQTAGQVNDARKALDKVLEDYAPPSTKAQRAERDELYDRAFRRVSEAA